MSQLDTLPISMDEDLDGPSLQVADLSTRITSLENLIQGFLNTLDQQRIVRQQRWLYVGLVGGHHAATMLIYWLAATSPILASPILQIAIFSALIGSATTLGVWHAISLRSTWQRWWRTLVALVPYCLMGSLAGVQGVLIYGGICSIYFAGMVASSRLLSHYTRTWLWAPDLPPFQAKTLKTSYFFLISAVLAAALALCRVVPAIVATGEDFTTATCMALLIYGIVYGSSIIAYLSVFVRWNCWWRRSLATLVLLVGQLAVNVLYLPVTTWLLGAPKIMGEAEWLAFPAVLQYLPQFLLGTAAMLISPAITLCILLHNGQKLIVGDPGAYANDESSDSEI